MLPYQDEVRQMFYIYLERSDQNLVKIFHFAEVING